MYVSWGVTYETTKSYTDRIPTNHPSSDPSMCPGNSSLATPLAQSR